MSAKLEAIRDILMDPDFQEHKEDGEAKQLGFASPKKLKGYVDQEFVEDWNQDLRIKIDSIKW